MTSEFFAVNLEALQRKQPELAPRVAAVASLRDQLLPTRSGAWTLQRSADDGTLKFLHSRYDPVATAKKTIDAFVAEKKIEALDVFWLFGLGLGYEFDDILARIKPASALIAFEPSLAVFRTWLETGDRREAIHHVNTLFYVEMQPQELYQQLRENLGRFMSSGSKLLLIPEADHIYTKYFGDIRGAILEFIKVGQFIMKTHFSLIRPNLKNRMENLAHYAAAQGIEIYKDAYRGKPGVCVLAGPSLAKNFELLRAFKGHAPLIAVSTTFKIMLDRDLKPDFVAFIDFQKLSRSFFVDIDPSQCVPMICDVKANSETVDGYPGPKVFYGEEQTDFLFDDPAMFRKDIIEGGGTVAHLAFSFARYLGCDPIILVGQDLAYSDGLTHIPGTVYFSWWRAEANRFNHYELIEWKFVRRDVFDLKPLQDWQGNKIYSTEHFLSYARELEGMIEKTTNRRVIDATEGGVVLKGTELMTLAEARDRYLDPQFDATLNIPPENPPAVQRERLGQAIAQMEKRLRECDEFVGILHSAIDNLNTIRNRLRNQKSVARLIEATKVCNDALARYPVMKRAISAITASDEFERQREDARILAEGLEGTAKQLAQTKRDYAYLTAIDNGTREFVRRTKHALEKMRRLREALG